tara:strand:+ start:5994 stop:6362 length:369 start_codon:yes stop_codon:yes gene_type:complete
MLDESMPDGKTLPDPKGWKILIQKMKPKEQTSGGIILVDASKEAESYLSITARVMKIGPMAWHDKDTGKAYVGGAWAKPGDWVIVPKFTQFKMDIYGNEYRFINDDEVIATVEDPTNIKVYT